MAEPAKKTKVAVIPPLVSGKLGVSAKAVLDERLPLGLKAAGLEVSTGTVITKALGPEIGPCDASCVIRVGRNTGCAFVAGATVKADHPFYDLHLWIADARQGKVLATVNQRCEVCPPAALGRKMDLSASKLVMRLKALVKRPGKLVVSSEPNGATITVDGKERGTAPLELELEPGAHEIVAKQEGRLAARRKVHILGTVTERITLQLLPGMKQASSTRPLLGWSATAVGAALIASGVVLMAMHDGSANCFAGNLETERCESGHNTLPLGALLAGAGAAAMGVGGYLLLSKRRQKEEPKASRATSPLSVKLGPSGLRLLF